MIDFEMVKNRNIKDFEHRYGISAIYYLDNNEILFNKLYNIVKQIERIFPDCFIWYPNWHITLIRCKSISKPFYISRNDDLYILMKENLKIYSKIKLTYVKSKIEVDGVLRVLFFKSNFCDNESIKKYYFSKNLNYIVVNNPWISLGNIKTDKFEKVKRNMRHLSEIVNQIFISNILIDKITFIYYEDILLKNNKNIDDIFLEG